MLLADNIFYVEAQKCKIVVIGKITLRTSFLRLLFVILSVPQVAWPVPFGTASP